MHLKTALETQQIESEVARLMLMNFTNCDAAGILAPSVKKSMRVNEIYQSRSFRAKLHSKPRPCGPAIGRAVSRRSKPRASSRESFSLTFGAGILGSS